MIMVMIKKAVAIFSLLLCTAPILARGAENTGYVTVPINVSLVPGFSIGERVAKGKNVKNHISLNILAGRAEKLEGIEAGVIFNKNSESVFGAQWAGIVNTVENLKAGVQFAGIVNVAEEVGHGMQIGLINASQINKGIPVGPVSYVRNVGIHFDAWTDETRFLNVGLRTGSERFYNVLFTGSQVNGPFRWSIGWVFGGHIEVGPANYIDVDISAQHINENEVWTDSSNTLYKFRFLNGMQINEAVSIFAGPTLNYLVSEVNNGSDYVTWSMSENNSGDHWKSLWPGFVAGVKF